MCEHGRKHIVARTFSMATTVDPSSLLARARQAARKNDATLLGDERSGRFSHEMVRDEYRMVGRTVNVTITDKLWLVPWPVVEAQLRELVQ
jgi:hypothetical protein